MGASKNAREGDTRGERERLYGRPPKILSRPLSNYLAALRDLSNLLTENWYHFVHWNAHLREILQHQSLHQIGISVEKIEGVSEVVCSPCGRKLLKLCGTFSSVSSALAEVSCEGDGGETFKRKIGAVLTPGRSPGNASRKQKRVTSPSKQTEGSVPRSKKTLFDKGNRSESEIADSVQAISSSDAMLSKLNVDDLNILSFEEMA